MRNRDGVAIHPCTRGTCKQTTSPSTSRSRPARPPCSPEHPQTARRRCLPTGSRLPRRCWPPRSAGPPATARPAGCAAAAPPPAAQTAWRLGLGPAATGPRQLRRMAPPAGRPCLRGPAPHLQHEGVQPTGDSGGLLSQQGLDRCSQGCETHFPQPAACSGIKLTLHQHPLDRPMWMFRWQFR